MPNKNHKSTNKQSANFKRLQNTKWKLEVATKYSEEKYQKGNTDKIAKRSLSLINNQVLAMRESVDSENNLAMKGIKGRPKIFPEVAAHWGDS